MPKKHGKNYLDQYSKGCHVCRLVMYEGDENVEGRVHLPLHPAPHVLYQLTNQLLSHTNQVGSVKPANSN